MNDYKWTLGVLIGLPVLGVVILLGVVVLGIGILMKVADWRRPKSPWGYDDSPGWFLIGSALTWLVFFGGVTAFAYYPYGAEYHQWRPVSGEVSQVQSRLLSAGDGGGSNQKYVVRFKGSRQEYGCEDTRCSLVKPGESLDLSCVQVWVYGGSDGFDCNFVRSNEAKDGA